MPKLICLCGMNKGDEYDLKDGDNTLGRGEKNDICIFDKKSSRRHCSVQISGDKLAIEDFESTNGVRVNNVFVSNKQDLKIGDHIRIGQTVFLVSDKSLTDKETLEPTTSVLIKRKQKYENLLQKTSFQATKTTSLRRVKMEKHGKETGFLSFLERKEENNK